MADTVALRSKIVFFCDDIFFKMFGFGKWIINACFEADNVQMIYSQNTEVHLGFSRAREYQTKI